MIELLHVNKCLGKKHIIKDLDLTIEDGVIFGLIGPNGAGKSTLLRLLAGIYQCDGGSIKLDGERIYNNAQRKRDILFVSDEPFQFFHATLQDMKEFYKTWYSLDEVVYHSYLELFHLDEHKPIANFSKGMKRQAFIILGLAIAPRYLLLDEAFDGLDPLMRRHFKQAIAERISEKKMTVIISSHDMMEMQDLCDHFAMLEEGTLTTGGAMEDTLKELHRIQMALKEEVSKDVFQALDIVSMDIRSKVVNLYVRGEVEKITAYLQTLEPLMMEVLPVNLEELFIQEVLHRREERS